MTSFIGASNSGYESISPYRLYLDLNTNDVEFNSGLISPLSFVDEKNQHYDYEEINSFVPKPNRSTLGLIMSDNRFKDF